MQIHKSEHGIMIKGRSVKPVGYIERSEKVNVVSKTGTQAIITAETNMSKSVTCLTTGLFLIHN